MNIFQRIAIEKALLVCGLFSPCFYPLEYVIQDYTGAYYTSATSPSYIRAKNWLLGQKIALASVLKLRDVGLLPELKQPAHLDFLTEDISLPSGECGEEYISCTSEPELGLGLKNTGQLMEALLSACGFETDAWEYTAKTIDELDDFIDPSDRAVILPCLMEDLELYSDDDEFLFFRFLPRYPYSYAELEAIFTNALRFSTVIIGECYVYLIAAKSESFEEAVFDEIDMSSMNPECILFALWYQCFPRPALPDLSGRTSAVLPV